MNLTVCVEELGTLGTAKLHRTNVIMMLSLKYLTFTNRKLIIATSLFAFIE